MGMISDAAVVLLSLATVGVIAVGMFLPVRGGGKPVNSWFPWHPVLMTAGCILLMNVGRLAYFFDAGWPGMRSFQGRRNFHAVMMVLAALTLCAGYVCVMVAHWPEKKFFGYDFKNGAIATPARLVHVWLGYAVLILVASQAVTGPAKRVASARGERIFISHGRVGESIIFLGLMTMYVACWFWEWKAVYQFVLLGVSGLAVVGGFAARKPLKEEEDETWPIAAQTLPGPASRNTC